MLYDPEPTHNHLLASLPPEVQGRLFTHMEPVSLPWREVIYECQQPMRHVYFPTDSIISMQRLLEDGSSTAVSIVGNEGVLGVTLYMGGNECSASQMLVQSAGHAFRLPKKHFKDEFDRHEEMFLLMLRYTQALLTQISQTAICNRNHVIVQQLCRWLLASMDRTGHSHLTMTQEFIANMLGVRREGVTEAAFKLQQLGVISYSRGKIEILDRLKLEELSCECYRVVREETDMLLHYLPQRRRAG